MFHERLEELKLDADEILGVWDGLFELRDEEFDEVVEGELEEDGDDKLSEIGMPFETEEGGVEASSVSDEPLPGVDEEVGVTEFESESGE